jgi:hypothetical protein
MYCERLHQYQGVLYEESLVEEEHAEWGMGGREFPTLLCAESGIKKPVSPSPMTGSGINVGIPQDKADVGRVDPSVNRDNRFALAEHAGGMLAVGDVGDTDGPDGVRLVVGTGANIRVDAHRGEQVGPAASIDILLRRRQVKTEDRIGIDVPVEDRTDAADRDARVFGRDEQHLDVGVQHRVGSPGSRDEHLVRLVTCPSGPDGIGAHVVGREPLAPLLAAGQGSCRRQSGINDFPIHDQRPLIRRDGDRLSGTRTGVGLA